MGSRAGGERVRELWKVGILTAVLSRTGEGPTGISQAAVDFLVSHGWEAETSVTRSTQLKKWLVFCDAEGRTPLPASEGDVLDYLGYMILEGRVVPTSVRQYV